MSTWAKMLKPEQHLEAGEILRALNLSFDFGFMLLEPYSTLESAVANGARLLRLGAGTL
jgi:anaerobic magnesium-protoporphyrin IX monomethyl ester cyclase